MPGDGEWQTAGLIGNADYPPSIALSRQNSKLLRVDPSRFVAHVVPATNDPLAPFNPIESNGLTLALVMPDAVLHRCAGLSLRPIRKGTTVLAVNSQGGMELVAWDPSKAPLYPSVLSANGSVMRADSFLDFRSGAMLGYKQDGNLLIEGPINGGEGSVVTRLGGTDLRILLRLKREAPAAFRF